MVNNFPTTTLIKNWFALKDRLVCLEHLRVNQFLINTVFEELFKKLCLSLVYLIMCAVDLLKILSSDGMVCCGKLDQTSRLDMMMIASTRSHIPYCRMAKSIIVTIHPNFRSPPQSQHLYLHHPSAPPAITITQLSPPVPPPQMLQVAPMPRVPMPPIPWGQHVHQYFSMELYHKPPPEPAQELQDSNMSSPGPSPVISQPPSYPEPPPSPSYIVTEPFTPYTYTSPPGCHHNTHTLQSLEIPSQPWREHLAYLLPMDHKCSISPSSAASPSQCTHLSDGGYTTPDISPMMEHPYNSLPSQALSPPFQASLVQSSTGSPEQPTLPPS